MTRALAESLGEKAETLRCRVKRDVANIKNLLNIGQTAGVNGFIYFAKEKGDNNLFKIGMTERHPSGRVHQLSGYGKDVWELIDYVELPGLANTRKVEKDIHKTFKKYRNKGELFSSACFNSAVDYTKDLSSGLYEYIQTEITGAIAPNKPKPKKRQPREVNRLSVRSESFSKAFDVFIKEVAQARKDNFQPGVFLVIMTLRSFVWHTIFRCYFSDSVLF